jgi:hypothetical protein
MNQGRLFALLAVFYPVFLLCAGLLQLRSGLPPQKSGPLDEFNAALLWAASVLGLLIAAQNGRPAWRMLFWMVVSAGFAALAIDEVFEFHEGTRFALGDDDYIKIAAWFCACTGSYMICQVSRPTQNVLNSLIIAVAFQTLWLLSDLGDGDFFTLPIPLTTLLWLEEYFEILASQFYLTALIMIYQDLLQQRTAPGEDAPVLA